MKSDFIEKREDLCYKECVINSWYFTTIIISFFAFVFCFLFIYTGRSLVDDLGVVNILLSSINAFVFNLYSLFINH